MTDPAHSSPTWSTSTKAIVAIVMLVIIGALLVRFNSLIGPLLLTFIISYLLHPLASWLSSRTRLSWRGAVNLIFALLLVLVILLSTATGFAVVDQLRNLTRVVENFVTNLPQLAQDLSTQVYHVGPFEFDFAALESQVLQQLGVDFATLAQQALNTLQPALGTAGTLLGAVATSALTTIGWGLFVLIISYFILADIGQVPDLLRSLQIPALDADLRRMGRELSQVWNAFLRGQLLLIVLIVTTSFILMSILGVRNALGLAFLAGLAKFVPYVGPLIAGITTALVAFFQGGNYLGIEPPFTYALIVVVAAVVLDQIFDNIVTPRIYGQALGVHPAAVLVAAFIAADLLGLVGLVLAAPVLASLQLFALYAFRKTLDLDPWPEPEKRMAAFKNPFEKPIQRLKQGIQTVWNKLKG